MSAAATAEAEVTAVGAVGEAEAVSVAVSAAATAEAEMTAIGAVEDTGRGRGSGSECCCYCRSRDDIKGRR